MSGPDASRCTQDLVELWLDTRLVSPNVREHHVRHAQRAARQRELVAMTFLQALGSRWTLEAAPARPKAVTVTAYVGRAFDDDNLISACKHLRDGLIDARLISGDAPGDGHQFTYVQRPGMPMDQQGVRISVRLLEPDPPTAGDAS